MESFKEISAVRKNSIVRLLAKCSFALALLATRDLAAQTTWIVDSSGRPGSHFLDIAAALPVAANGDVLLVRVPLPTTQTAYTLPPMNGRNLVLVGEKVAGAPFPTVHGAIDIDSIPLGTAMVFEGLSISPNSVNVRNCPGSLVFSGCELVFPNSAIVADTAFALFHECSLLLTPSSGASNLGMMRLLRSRVQLEDSSVSFPSFPSGAGTFTPPPTLYVIDSMLHLTASRIRGVLVASMVAPGIYSYATGPAARLDGASTVVATGGSVLESGSYVLNGIAYYPSQAVVAPNSTAQARVERDPSAHWNGAPVADYLVDVVVQRDGLRAHVAEGNFALEHYARPGSLSVLMIAPLGPPQTVLGVGTLLVDPLVAITDLAIAPTGRPTMRAYSVPSSIPLGSWIAVQAGSLRTDGTVAVSNTSIAGVF
jgi:hypothetical protein